MRAAFRSTQAAKLAEAAAQFGNGEIDLTRRANLQIRGVTPETLEPLQHALDALGLLDASAGAEAARNIVVSPLAGVDPTELIDVTPLALDLEARLAADRRLWRLPVKFGFVIDGGGVLSLDHERADIRLKAISDRDVAVGIDAADGVCWLGAASAAEAVDVAVRVALRSSHCAPRVAECGCVSCRLRSPQPLRRMWRLCCRKCWIAPPPFLRAVAGSVR